MKPEPKTSASTLPEQDPPARDFPVESGKQILINWIIVALGLGGIAAAGAILPDLHLGRRFYRIPDAVTGQGAARDCGALFNAA